jgi:hypothetical protein
MKLERIFQSFSKKDWHWAEKWFESPIFNSHEKVLAYFRYLKNGNKRTIFSKNLQPFMFPEAPENTAKMHHLNNYLLKGSEAYLAWENWQQEPFGQELALLFACRRRGLTAHFHEVKKRLWQQLQGSLRRDSHWYRTQYRLALEEYHQTLPGRSAGAGHLQPLSEWHDLAFIAEKLRNACIFASMQRVASSESADNDLLPLILEYVRTRPQWLEKTAIGAYYYGYMALKEPREAGHFYALKNFLPRAAAEFSWSELRDLYLLAINFCIHRINLREEAYLREVFELYQNGLQSGVFIEQDHISRFTYTNIAMAGLRLREFGWTYQFLLDYRDRLPENGRQGTYAFNLARYFCEKGDYERAMPLLQEMAFDDVLHNLAARAMLLRMYFETSAGIALESLMTSWSVYLRRKRQIPPQQREAYQHLIQFTRKLWGLPRRDRRLRRLLAEEIAATVPVAEKDWLLRQLEG